VSVGLSKGQKTRPRIARCTISGGMWNQKWARLLAYVQRIGEPGTAAAE